MDDTASVILNGVEGRAPALLLVKGNANCEIVEPQANLIGIVDFDNVDDRGWPCEVDSAQLVTTHPARFEALQAITRDALTLASHSPDALLQPHVIGSIEESILQAFDLAMDAALPSVRRQAPEPEPLSDAGQKIRRVPCGQRRQDGVQR